jgi:hypothetical protein
VAAVQRRTTEQILVLFIMKIYSEWQPARIHIDSSGKPVTT